MITARENKVKRSNVRRRYGTRENKKKEKALDKR